jgi:AP-1 complex subunit mu
MAASAAFILDHKGKVLICRNYRGDVPMSVASKFVSEMLMEEEVNVKPVVEVDGVSFVYVKYNSLYLLATTERNANAGMVLVYLYRLIEVFKSYFKEIEEESIRDNFIIIYELMDEMMDFGYPQTTEAKLLQEYITQEGFQLDNQQAKHVIGQVTGQTPWRQQGIKYRKNEVFLDVVESINLLVSANGTILRSEIVGAVKVKACLSGMPDLRLGLNDKVRFDVPSETKSSFEEDSAKKKSSIELDDVKFHQCVRLSRFDRDRTISFIPPDDEFELMSYRLNTSVRPLIWVEAIIDAHAHSRVEYLIKAKAQFKQANVANNVQIIVPVPPDADSPKFSASMGTAKYAPEKDAIIWTIKQFQGGKEAMMRAHFGLPSILNEEVPEKKPPISVKFEIPYYAVSGIQVRYLKIVEKSGYQALPWVRYVCMSGDYQFRTR